jgi:glutaredoxin
MPEGLKNEMQDRKQVYKKIFLAVSVLAMIFVLTEIVMQSLGKSICQTEGCKVAAQYVRYGDISILLIGLVTFSLLTLLSFLELYLNKIGVGWFINLVLIVSLACEGFFTGYQTFSIHTPCLFCLIIFAFILVLGIIRLLAGERELIAGLLSLAAVFSMLYLVLPAGAPVDLPASDHFILFFSKDCKHCAEVIQNLDQNKIEVKHVEVTAYSAFLKSMGIDTVPTLMVNVPSQKLFITGKDAILRYLLACTPSQETKANDRRKAKGKASAAVSAPGMGPAGDIFFQPSLLTEPSVSAEEDGMCKQGEICK